MIAARHFIEHAAVELHFAGRAMDAPPVEAVGQALANDLLATVESVLDEAALVGDMVADRVEVDLGRLQESGITADDRSRLRAALLAALRHRGCPTLPSSPSETPPERPHPPATSGPITEARTAAHLQVLREGHLTPRSLLAECGVAEGVEVTLAAAAAGGVDSPELAQALRHRTARHPQPEAFLATVLQRLIEGRQLDLDEAAALAETPRAGSEEDDHAWLDDLQTGRLSPTTLFAGRTIAECLELILAVAAAGGIDSPELAQGLQHRAARHSQPQAFLATVLQRLIEGRQVDLDEAAALAETPRAGSEGNAPAWLDDLETGRLSPTSLLAGRDGEAVAAIVLRVLEAAGTDTTHLASAVRAAVARSAAPDRLGAALLEQLTRGVWLDLDAAEIRARTDARPVPGRLAPAAGLPANVLSSLRSGEVTPLELIAGRTADEIAQLAESLTGAPAELTDRPLPVAIAARPATAPLAQAVLATLLAQLATDDPPDLAQALRTAASFAQTEADYAAVDDLMLGRLPPDTLPAALHALPSWRLVDVSPDVVSALVAEPADDTTAHGDREALATLFEPANETALRLLAARLPRAVARRLRRARKPEGEAARLASLLPEAALLRLARALGADDATLMRLEQSPAARARERFWTAVLTALSAETNSSSSPRWFAQAARSLGVLPSPPPPVRTRADHAAMDAAYSAFEALLAGRIAAGQLGASLDRLERDAPALLAQVRDRLRDGSLPHAALTIGREPEEVRVLNAVAGEPHRPDEAGTDRYATLASALVDGDGSTFAELRALARSDAATLARLARQSGRGAVPALLMALDEAERVRIVAVLQPLHGARMLALADRIDELTAFRTSAARRALWSAILETALETASPSASRFVRRALAALSEATGRTREQLVLGLRRALGAARTRAAIDGPLREGLSDLTVTTEHRSVAVSADTAAWWTDDAGVVLLGVFLPRLFAKLDVLNDGDFANDEARRRAQSALRLAVWGDTWRERPERRDAVTAAVTGSEPNVPRDAVELEDAAIAVVDDMLAAVTASWTAIGRTSIQGLREAFLQRPGVLRLEQEAWRLRVESRAYDMLVDRLPWTYALQRHRWMRYPLFVDWRG